MRHNQNRRSRGRSSNSNRKGPNPLTRSYESNGPDVKVRGTAMHVAEKYMTLARDAQSSGDIVAAENYLQHAEHYNRIVMAAQAQFQQERQVQFRDGPEEGYDDQQMNGRGIRDRFESNRDVGRSEEDGEERYEGGGEEEERGFQPRDDRGYQPRQPRDDRDQPRQPRGDERPRHARGDDRDQPRGPRPDRFERRERPEYSEGADRPERVQRSEEPREEAAAPIEANPPGPEESVAQPRRRRGRPARAENGGEAAEPESPDATQDGAAALIAFPD